MQRQTVATVLVAAMLAVAGCGSGVSPDGDDGGEGTVNMYISDQQNAIDDFEHLNVTVTEIAAHRVDDPDTEENESEWVEKDIDNVTVDLTELQGENASQLGAIEAPNGTYNKVFVHVDSDIDGTLADGSSADVKLPSNKLHLNTNFTVGDGEEIDFVFDMTVFERGGDQGYILKPVASESGPDKEFREKPSAKRAGDRGQSDGTDTSTDASASLDFYISDEENAIGDFEHLNVTIEKVGVHRADDGGENESAWVETDVNNTTVDLTELQGANASKLGTLAVENGTYDKTFVYVSEVNGTLTDGTSTDVKLPSSKLQIEKQFTVGDGEAVDFVFDISVVKRGNSGSYNIKPVVSESGTSDQVDIEERDDKTEDEREDEQDDETETETDAPALNVTLDGNATAGENVTVSVIQNGSAVSGAEVSANGEDVGETDENGTLVVSVPADAEELELEVETDDQEAELTVDVQQPDSTEASTETETSALVAPAL